MTAAPEDGFARAMAALNGGQVAEAERLLRQLQGAAPADPRLMHMLGLIALQTGRPAEAVQQFEKAVATHPDEPGFRGLLGNAYRAAGRLDAARDAYLAVLADDPGSVPARINLGNLALEQGRLDEAEAHYRRAAEIEPAHPEVQNGLGQLALGRVPADGTVPDADPRRQAALATAAGHFERALRAAPDHPAALSGRGKVAAARGDTATALAALDRALRVAPGQPDIAVSLGKTALRAGRLAPAKAALEHALRVLPPWPGGQAERQYAHCYLSYVAAAAGDLAGYAALADPAEMVLVGALDGDCTGLNAALAEEILSQTPLTWEPADTTTSAGRQSGDLSRGGGPAITAFRARLAAAVTRRIDDLPFREGHPFLGHRPRRYRFNLWATVLHEGGHQRPHIHPRGWMSGVYYVQVPDLAADAPADAGRLELGRPEALLDSAGVLPPERLSLVTQVAAVPGRLVFFPSYLFHRTIPFRGADDRPRISLAFDILPEA